MNITELTREAMGAGEDWDPLNNPYHSNLLLARYKMSCDLDGDPTKISGTLTFNGNIVARATVILGPDFYADYRRLIATLVAITMC